MLSIVSAPQQQHNINFLSCFPFFPSVLSLSHLFYVTQDTSECIYKHLLLSLAFMIYLLLCLLYSLGCTENSADVNLSNLSRKLFLTAIIPNDFFSIFLQLLMKLYFLKPCEFSLTVLHNSMHSTISFPSIIFFPSSFSFCQIFGSFTHILPTPLLYIFPHYFDCHFLQNFQGLLEIKVHNSH